MLTQSEVSLLLQLVTRSYFFHRHMLSTPLNESNIIFLQKFQYIPSSPIVFHCVGDKVLFCVISAILIVANIRIFVRVVFRVVFAFQVYKKKIVSNFWPLTTFAKKVHREFSTGFQVCLWVLYIFNQSVFKFLHESLL